MSVRKNLHILIMGENGVSTFSRLFFILAGNDDIHKSLDEFEILPDLTKVPLSI